MSYADEIRRQAEAAPRAALPAVAVALWKAYGAGQVSEAEAEALSALIEARQTSAAQRGANARGMGISGDTPPNRPGCPRTGVGSRPVSSASLERRRRWAASGRLPPALAARFTLAEQAILALVAAETARRGDCRLAIEHMGAVVGVARSTVKNAIREAQRLGLITVEERKVTGFRNDTNIVRVVSPEWSAWLRLARKDLPSRQHPSLSQGGGVKSATGTPTDVLYRGKTDPFAPSQGLPGTGGRPRRGGSAGIGEGGGTSGAMR